MTQPTDPQPDEALVERLAALNGIPLDPAWRANIALQFAITGKVAAAVLDFPLDDHEDSGPVFVPGKP
jgi:Protein of unknown function (DUF4089)